MGDTPLDFVFSSSGPDGRPRRGRLFVVSGPSGVGKDTVLAQVIPQISHLLLNISATTRSPRTGETEGNPYFFVPLADFRTMVEMGAFLEHAKVNGNYYGTPRRWVEEQREMGNDVLLKIDVQGGLAVRTKVRDAVLVFLMPPSFEELERRLRARSTETEDQINTRLIDARSELLQMPNYDYVVVNDEITRAADLIHSIILAERCRIRHDGGPEGTHPSVPWSPPHE